MNGCDFEHSDVRIDGLRKLGEGVMAEVFGWPGGGALKLLRASGATAAISQEATNMRAAEATGVPMARILGTVVIEGRPGILMEQLDGIDQLTRLGRQPWTVWQVGASLGRLHAQLHAIEAGVGLRPLKDALHEAIGVSHQIPGDLKPFLLGELHGLPETQFLCHGDFHPGNVIETRDGPRIIDWENATCGDRLADVARTLVLVRCAELPPGVPRLLRVVLRGVRRVLITRYLHEYRQRSPFDESELKRWEVLATASRLMDGVTGEREALLRVLRREAARPTA